jgi:hypothetical protein
MNRECYQRRYREAMFKALTAQSETVRSAYHDLENSIGKTLGSAPPSRIAA